MIQVRALTGAQAHAALDDVARLRITVFRDWPYLYDGTLEYERAYLAPFADSANCVLVAAFQGPRLIGAATGAPMEDHQDDFAAPLAQTGMAARDVFYCAESVLLPDFRGQGLGHRFFDLRESHGRALGRTWSVFFSVIRPQTHPDRPADYRPLDPFWRGRGYAPVPGIEARFAWRDLGHATETVKPLQLWRSRL